MLGLSVQEKLIFTNISEKEHQEEETKLIDMYKKEEYVNFIKDKQYDMDTCCVCLDKKPNTLFYPCSHLVVDTECGKKLIKCPMCREIINAKLNIN